MAHSSALYISEQRRGSQMSRGPGWLIRYLTLDGSDAEIYFKMAI